MKKIALILIVFAGIASTMAFNTQDTVAQTEEKDGINFFDGTFKEALAEAKKQNKPIFMDSYTSWCHWCKVLNKTTFKDPAVINYLNANFINLKMNMEKGEGPSLAREFKVSGYPTLLFLDYDREVISTVVGYKKADAFLVEAKKAIKDY